MEDLMAAPPQPKLPASLQVPTNSVQRRIKALSTRSYGLLIALENLAEDGKKPVSKSSHSQGVYGRSLRGIPQMVDHLAPKQKPKVTQTR